MSEPMEPICFVPTGADHKAGEYMPCSDDMPLVTMKLAQLRPGYRRLPPGWVAEAVERVRTAYAKRNEVHGGGCWHPTPEALRAALFPAPEPEPEAWEREAAKEWLGGDDPSERAIDELARHFAKARAKAGKAT